MGGRFQAIVFDLDGTLVDSAPDLHAAAERMLADIGRPGLTLEQVTGFVGNGVPKLVERCLAATGGVPADGAAAALAIFSAHYGREPTRLTRPYPGVMRMLQALTAARVPMGVCTNKPEEPARQVLEGMGMGGVFASVVGGDRLAVHKPDPAPLMLCLQELGAEVAAAAYVGDSETDAATAGAARMPFALFTGGYRKTPVAELAHDFAFARFEELAEWIVGERAAVR